MGWDGRSVARWQSRVIRMSARVGLGAGSRIRAWRTASVMGVAAVAILIASGQVLAVDPPEVSSPHPVSTPVYQVAPQGRYAGDVVAGDSGYLAVWEDFRTYDTSHSEIYAARIAGDGTVLDPGGIRVTSASGQQAAPRVAWSGSEYLVVWTDFDDPYRSTGDDIYGARIAADGTVLDPDGVPIGNTQLDEWQPDVAWNGSAWVVAWTAMVGNGSDIRVERLTSDLETIGPSDLSFAASSYAQSNVALAVEGTTTVAIYTDARDSDTGDGTNVYMNLLSESGGMLDDGFPIATETVNEVAGGVAASPSGVLATWTAFEGGASGVEPVVHARRFIGGSPAGPALDIAGSGEVPSVAWGPDGYLVAWDAVEDDAADIMGRLVSLQAVAGDVFPITSGTQSENLAAIAAGDGGYLVTATDKHSHGGAGLDALGIRLDGPTVLDIPPLRFATAARPQDDPVLVDVGGSLVAVWAEEDVDTGWDIRMGRLSPDGVLLDGDGAVVAGTSGVERFPSVGWDGSRVLVTWWDDADPVGRMLARPMQPDGTPSGAATVLGTGVTQHRAAIASAGEGFAVAWGRQIVGLQNEIRLQMFDGGGDVAGASTVLVSPAYGPFVALAPLGDGYLASWSTTVVEARRLAADGTAIDSAPLVLSSSDTDFYEEFPAIASSGNQALVTWIRRNLDVVQAVRIDLAGVVLDPAPLDLSAATPGLQGAGAGWNGLTYEAVWWATDGSSLVGAEVNAVGETLTTLASVPGHSTGSPPTVASGTNGRVAVGYGLLDLGPVGGGVQRAVVRFVDVQRPPVSGSSVAIDDGAPATRTSAATLAVPAANATRVALSNDGATWTERTYAASQPWSLPASNGTKTVWVKWRDAVGAWSSPKSDSIVLDTIPPTATTPVSRFVVGGLTSGRAPVRLSWQGADGQSGIARFDLARRTDGGAWSVPAIATSASLTPTLVPGHRYQFRVRAVDRAGNVDSWRSGASFTLRAVSQASSVVRYRGAWSSSTSSAWWGGTARSSSTAGATATYTFTGRSIAWVGREAANRGKARIYVNGVLKATVDLYSATTLKQRIVWSANYTTSATRTITIKVLGTPGRPRVDVDGFLVSG